MKRFLFTTILSATFANSSFAATVAGPSANDLTLLKDLVMISSKTEDVDGVNKVQARMAQELRALGFQTQTYANPGKDLTTGTPLVSGEILIATLSGQSPKYITLVTHSDTVFKTLNPFLLSADGKTAKGSGVGDNKGGFVVGLKALKRLLATEKTYFSIRVVITPSEETGSNGFQESLKKLSEDSVAVFGLEPTMPDGSFITKRKGLTWYDISVIGRAAHSGVAPQDGVNACYELSKKLVMAQDLSDFSEGKTVSIGKWTGGAPAANTVCPGANATLDSRFWTVDQGRQLAAAIQNILSQHFVRSITDGMEAKTEFKIINSTPPFDPAAATAPFVEFYKSAVLSVEGQAVNDVRSGGGADLNFMSRPGLIAFDGLGPVTRGTHTDNEEIDIATIETRAQALAALLSHTDQQLRPKK